MDVIRVGIIGVGGMGRHHASYMNDLPGVKLTAVCDISPTSLDWAASKFGDTVLRFDTPKAFFKADAVDAVLIATPHYEHPPLAIDAFERGLHVLTEKPAGVYTKQVREMNDAAAESGKVFGIMFNQRAVVQHQKMKDIVASGELGEIRRTHYMITDWFRTQAYYNSGGWRATWAGEGGGVLINQCPHNLDLWQWMCGLPERVRAFCSFGKYHDIEVEDDVTAYVEYENGATGVFITTTGEAPGSNSFEITGDRGRLLLANGKLTFWRTQVPVRQFIRESDQGFARPDTWTCEIPGSGDPGHIFITRNWIKSIREGTPLLAPGTEGIKGLQLSNAMHLSAWTDDWVDVPVDEDEYLKQLKKRVKKSKRKTDAQDKANEFAGTF